jgi:hypothetical protein
MAAALAAAAVPFATLADTESSGQHTFAVRADLGLAPEIDTVLARITVPQQVRIPEGSTAKRVVQELCGTRAPSQIEEIDLKSDTGTTRAVRFPTCLRQKTNVHVIAHIADNLEGIAVRLGMRRSSKGQLRIVQLNPLLAKLLQKPFLPGDTVIAPIAPDWTTISAKPGEFSTRGELVDRIAEAIGCGAENHESCLARRSIVVIDRGATTPANAASAAGVQPQFSAAFLPKLRPALYVSQSRRETTGLTPVAMFMLAAAVARSPATPIPVTADALRNAIIAPDQWPYDKELAARVLSDGLPPQPKHPVEIGVAENGLRNRDGAPLTRTMFVTSLEKGPPLTKRDVNRDGYIDDFVGAGIGRDSADASGTGDVGLCAAEPPPFLVWQGDALQVASHGSVVTSIAAGRDFLVPSQSLADALPKIMFFRTSADGCVGSAGDGAEELSALQGLQFLGLRNVAVINFSGLVDGAAGDTLSNEILLSDGYGVSLYVFPATDRGINLDDNPVSPQRLGNPTYAPAVSRDVIVVGAATSNRTRWTHSGFGDSTVRLYAPGEPRGAVNILGQDISYPVATSYSAPLASFAIAVMKAQNMSLTRAQLRARLLLSTWEMNSDAGTPMGRGDGRIPIGILDLVKAATINHSSVETLQQQPDGTKILRTYVGDISGGLDSLCPEGAIDTDGLQALILNPASLDGARKIELFPTAISKDSHQIAILPDSTCRPSGVLTLQSLGGGTLALPWTAITKILLPIG